MKNPGLLSTPQAEFPIRYHSHNLSLLGWRVCSPSQPSSPPHIFPCNQPPEQLWRASSDPTEPLRNPGGHRSKHWLQRTIKHLQSCGIFRTRVSWHHLEWAVTQGAADHWVWSVCLFVSALPCSWAQKVPTLVMLNVQELLCALSLFENRVWTMSKFYWTYICVFGVQNHGPSSFLRQALLLVVFWWFCTISPYCLSLRETEIYLPFLLSLRGSQNPLRLVL